MHLNTKEEGHQEELQDVIKLWGEKLLLFWKNTHPWSKQRAWLVDWLSRTLKNSHYLQEYCAEISLAISGGRSEGIFFGGGTTHNKWGGRQGRVCSRDWHFILFISSGVEESVFQRLSLRGWREECRLLWPEPHFTSLNHVVFSLLCSDSGPLSSDWQKHLR